MALSLRTAALPSAWVVALLSLGAMDLVLALEPAKSGQTNAFSGKMYVRSESELELHFRSHVDRVVRLGLEARTRTPEFRDLDADLVKRFLSLHDQAKINHSMSFERRFGVDRKMRPLTALARLYGKRIEELSDGERKLAESIRSEVNRIDHAVGQRFFRNHGLLTESGEPNAVAQKLLRIEKIADTVDRAMSPVSGEEFHKVMESSAKWLKIDADKEIAAGLERDYRSLTYGLSYDDALGSSHGTCMDLFSYRRWSAY